MRPLLVLALCATTVSASAQGFDSCSNPMPIAGPGTYAFDNSAAANALNTPMCTTAVKDVWFQWTVQMEGVYSISTCGGTTLDTVIAINHPTDVCGNAGFGCNDDACASTQSLVSFHANAGTIYRIQIATRTGPGGSGTFTLAAGAPCATSTGPDLIVGAIQGTQNYTAANGLDAFNVGGIVCNTGDGLAWFHPQDGLHPVVANHLYRYRVDSGAGRFEQIGISWLYHFWGAEDETYCCSPCAEGGLWSVGSGCSAAYTTTASGGDPGYLTRRYDIDAWGGSYPFPQPTSGGGATGRRLEYLVSDVVPAAGTRFFVETQYLHPQEVVASNRDDNAGYREVNSNGTGLTIPLVGGTQRSPAIEAWASCETGVAIVEARVPGEGLFHVAFKSTALGGGQWHYEYAVHNLNSHRSAGSFSIPVGTANVTNVGFHDVQYRNGDGENGVDQSDLDWAVTNVGGVLTWSTETQAANSNANALRWGTTYNFRFEADVAPLAAAANIGLWRAGAPGSIVAVVQAPGSSNASAYCFGDGTGTACPCANAGASGNGCASSVNALGANLAVSGVASVAVDSLALTGTGMPDSSALYFQGTTQTGGGSGTVFGDGLRCAGGATVRLATKTNAAGTSTYPVAGNVLISVRGGVAAGDVRTYQCWYRNAAAFCSPSTFNLTNGLQVTWGA